jgi:hypothetical protein
MTGIKRAVSRRRPRFEVFPNVLRIVALLALTGCGPLDSPLAPPKTVVLAPVSASMITRPWEGSCKGTGIIRPDLTTLDITGTCHLSHLGLTTMVGVELLGVTLSATHTFTTANGDLLYTTTVGQATLKPDFSGVTFSNIETVRGGTGRFANATGTATRIGSSNFSDGSGSWEIQGTLTYAASDRR